MNFIFKNKKIEGILSILPKNTVYFNNEIKNYSLLKERSLKLKKLMGYNKRRIVKKESSLDLCCKGLKYLLKKNLINIKKIDVILVITQTPDYIIPPTSNLIQSKFSFKKDVICIDINQGCAGYVIGLFQSFMLLNHNPISKVLLFNVDTLSKKVSKYDRNSNPIVGDAASITLLKNFPTKKNSFFSIKMYDKNNLALHIPAGGSKMPISKKTFILKKDLQGNIRSLNDLVMQGEKILNFVQSEVPKVIKENIKFSNLSIERIEKYIFHQPNKFVLNKLIERLKIPLSKTPTNIVERFGNSSGPTIPLTIAYNLKELKKRKMKVCMSGFGSGLTAASVVLELGKLKFCKLI